MRKLQISIDVNQDGFRDCKAHYQYHLANSQATEASIGCQLPSIELKVDPGLFGPQRQTKERRHGYVSLANIDNLGVPDPIMLCTVCGSSDGPAVSQYTVSWSCAYLVRFAKF
jgi:hypothetical protein